MTLEDTLGDVFAAHLECVLIVTFSGKSSKRHLYIGAARSTGRPPGLVPSRLRVKWGEPKTGTRMYGVHALVG